jgi:peptide subunit release factor 1 (eRF1)
MAAAIRKTIVDVGDRDRFRVALSAAQDFVSAHSPAGKALVLFFDTTDRFFWQREVAFPMMNQLRWDRELFLQPLANALDQLEGYGVALVDRAKSRLFVVAMDEVEEVVHKDLDSKTVRHLKTAGTDQAGSSSRNQRKAGNQVRANLRGLVREMENILKSKKLRCFILAGTSEMTSELRKLLPARLVLTVIGEINIAINATPKQILSATQPIAEQYERTNEVEKVRNVVTSAEKKSKAVVGLGPTLKAVNAGRVWELVYCGGFVTAGFECPSCSTLFSARSTRCPFCASRVRVVENVVERAVEHALRNGAKIEVVTGDAAAALQTAGGIGAFLKTRTGTLEV